VRDLSQRKPRVLTREARTTSCHIELAGHELSGQNFRPFQDGLKASLLFVILQTLPGKGEYEV
jgi:hypothetical protein